MIAYFEDLIQIYLKKSKSVESHVIKTKLIALEELAVSVTRRRLRNIKRLWK